MNKRMNQRNDNLRGKNHGKIRNMKYEITNLFFPNCFLFGFKQNICNGL